MSEPESTTGQDFYGQLADKNIIDGYGGNKANASHRSFIDIQPNISVRTEFNRSDYYRFRTGEAVPNEGKHVTKMCMEAYDTVGIIKNIIDLMGDFASQGITLTHEDSTAQRLYRKWWKAVKGVERSERFLNTLYRAGSVIVKRRYAKLSKKMRKQLAKAQAKDSVEIPVIDVEKNVVPFAYDILNPLQVSVRGGAAGIFFGKPVYQFNISTLVSSSLREKDNADILATLPESLQKAIKDNKTKIDLDPNDIKVYHYKKDDWQLWGNPMIYAILDDIVMLEKMKLADMAALDGAISNVRLWTLGDLEYKIVPSRTAIDKLRDILASNVGGGTMDLVWGPELKFTESNTQIYKFLGDEKYIPVLNAIYAGLGIPPTLTGLAGQSGGYTNNFVSLKTLVDRLEYGRTLLEDFWNDEIRLVQKALGLAKPAKIRFDHMILSDEAAEKNLLMGLADRGYISLETLRERLGEDHDLENKRTKKEYAAEKKGTTIKKRSPFPSLEDELTKIALQKGFVGVKDVTDIDPKHAPPLSATKPAGPNGRPPFKKDSAPRKQKVVKPKTTPTMTKAILWADMAYRKVVAMLEPCLLEHFGKVNLRALTKDEKKLMLDMELAILSNLPLFAEVTANEVNKANKPMNPKFEANLAELVANFMSEYSISPSVDEMRQLITLAYAVTFCE